jgi:YjbE family integral membrane protein
MFAHFDQGTFAAYFEVIVINLLLSGDNVIVIAMAAAGLVADLRNKAIAVGITAAAAIRIVFAVIAVKLMTVVGITFIGGLLLLWICWTMFRELRSAHDGEAGAAVTADEGGNAALDNKLFRQAILQIIIADVSMSLDNTLAIAGAVKQNMNALIFGLVLSVLLMGLASSFIAGLLNRYRWLAWVGLAIILYVALSMVLRGGNELLGLLPSSA